MATATWNPSDYRRHSSQQQQWARELIAKLRLNGGEDVLDIGCGDGKVTAELATHVPSGNVIGLDSSSDMVKFAAEAFPPSQHPNLRFAVGDASRLDFDEQFDVIFSNATLHWIWDHRPVLAGIHKALRAEGRILFQMGGEGCAAEVLATVQQMMSAERWHGYFKDFSFRYGFHGPNEYRQWLIDAGLKPLRIELFPKDMTHDGAQGLAGWLRTTWMPWIHRVPREAQEEFVAELVERYLCGVPIDKVGLAHVRMIRLEVEATRPTN